MPNKLPTAEEMEMSGKYDDYQSMMRAFAKLHVEAALSSALENVRIKIHGFRKVSVYKDSILKSYPLTNIE